MNTEPILVMRAEGRDDSALAAIIEDVNSNWPYVGFDQTEMITPFHIR